VHSRFLLETSAWRQNKSHCPRCTLQINKQHLMRKR
jgi:hypothetical protein